MTDKRARVWNGSDWVNISSPVGVPNSIMVYQSEPPLSPVAGQVWVKSDESQGYFVSSTVDLSLKANLLSPIFNGIPSAPTATPGTSTNQIATTSFVTEADNLKANLASPTFTGTISVDNLNLSGLLTISESTETLSPGTISAGVFTANFNTAGVFYITTAPTANFTINVTNMPTTDNRITVLPFFVIQGATGFIPNTLQIGGSAQTIKWSGGSAPTGTNGAGKLDVFTFTFIRRSSSWEVLGSSDMNY